MWNNNYLYLNTTKGLMYKLTAIQSIENIKFLTTFHVKLYQNIHDFDWYIQSFKKTKTNNISNCEVFANIVILKSLLRKHQWGALSTKSYTY